MLDKNYKPLFPIKFTLLLVIILVVPLLRRIFVGGEPYPAILLPSGATKINLANETVSVRIISIYGYGRDGRLHRITAQQLLSPIPNHYLFGIVRNEFGLTGKTDIKLWDKILNMINVEIKRKNIQNKEENIQEAKTWLKHKLEGLELSNSSIIVRHELLEIDRTTGKEVTNKINNEQVFELD